MIKINSKYQMGKYIQQFILTLNNYHSQDKMKNHYSMNNKINLTNKFKKRNFQKILKVNIMQKTNNRKVIHNWYLIIGKQLENQWKMNNLKLIINLIINLKVNKKNIKDI